MSIVQPPNKIAHIGIAVKNIDQSIPLYTQSLGIHFLGIETVESEKVRVAFFQIGDTQIELLEPTSDDSPIAQFIQKKGEGIHHIAFQVDDAAESLRSLKRQGVRVINDIPKQGAHGNLVAFVHPKSVNGVLIELCQIAGTASKL